MAPRLRRPPTDDWRQIELLTRAPGQCSYELIRPVVLFGRSPVERAAETGAAERTLYRQVARFELLGMASFVPPPKVGKHRTLPPKVRQAILDAKREHPTLRVHELTTICWVRFGHRPSSHTVKRVLAESPLPPRTHRRFPEEAHARRGASHRTGSCPFPVPAGSNGPGHSTGAVRLRAVLLLLRCWGETGVGATIRLVANSFWR